MKIEKINKDQIRCTLTKEDLARRGIKVSELAYGTEKASELFRDMMEQANEKFGFSADDIPIMAEAIPVNSDCLVIIFTRVDDPEELDTRFSNFAPSVYYDEDDPDFDAEDEDPDTDFEGLFSQIQEGGMSGLLDNEYSGINKLKTRLGSGKQARSAAKDGYRVFSFALLMDVTRIARQIDPVYQGKNTLYHDKRTGRYLLLVHRSSQEDAAFEKVCFMLSEYGTEERPHRAGEQYLEEHGGAVLRDNALQTLRG